jgi:hypothetical protein
MTESDATKNRTRLLLRLGGTKGLTNRFIPKIMRAETVTSSSAPLLYARPYLETVPIEPARASSKILVIPDIRVRRP